MSAGGAGLATTNSVTEFGLKITPAEREYYRYTGHSEEVERHGIHDLPRPDFSRLPECEPHEGQDPSAVDKNA